MDINDFINSIDNKLYNRLRGSMSDAECRRYLMEHAIKQLSIHGVSNSASVKSSGDFRDDDNRESQAEYYGRK